MKDFEMVLLGEGDSPIPEEPRKTSLYIHELADIPYFKEKEEKRQFEQVNQPLWVMAGGKKVRNWEEYHPQLRLWYEGSQVDNGESPPLTEPETVINGVARGVLIALPIIRAKREQFEEVLMAAD